MVSKCRLLIVEDHRIVRDGLRALLATEPDLEVVGEVDNGRDAVHQSIELKPDVVVMDLSLPNTNGTEAIRNLRRRMPEIQVVVLTAHRAEEYVHAALQAGASAFVLKDDGHTDLLVALRSVRRGKTYLSPGVCTNVISSYLDGRKPATTPFDRLTHREREVIKLVAEGHRNKQIAALLSLSPKTVEKHRTNLMRKLSLHSASALTAWAFENGLVNR